MRSLVTVAELTEMEPSRKERALDALVRRAQVGQPNGSLSAIDGQIRAFETRYEMSSDDMLARFKRREQSDTAEISRWMMLLSARARAR